MAESVETVERLGFETLSVLPGAIVRKDPGAIVIRTGVKAALFNGLFRVRWAGNDIGATIDQYMSEFAEESLPFMVHLSDLSTPNNIGEFLLKRGFEPQPPSGMFTLELEKLVDLTPLPKGFRVKRVETKDEIDHYLAIFVQGFKLPPLIAEAFRTFFANYGVDESRPFQSLILYEHDKPVGIASVLGSKPQDSSAGEFLNADPNPCTIMNLAIAPHARGRGLGAKISIEAVRFAIGRGYRLLCSTGTPEGMALYRKAPIVDVGTCQRWVWNPKT